MKVYIIGGGAAGMMAALSAAVDPNNTVTILERQNRVGKKLLATGNGRCNLTNLHADVSHYHGQHPDFVKSALHHLNVRDTLAYFRNLGLYTVAEESGKVYPLSDQANSVVDTLRFALEQRGINVITSCDVLSISKKARGFHIETTGDSYFADKLIVTCGGCAGKGLGGTRSGYRLLGSMGHTVTELHPALVQIKTLPDEVRSLKGVRADCAITVKANGHVIAQSAGEIQFTDFGVSGPVAFELSRAVSTEDGEMVLLLDLMRDYTEDELTAAMLQRCQTFPQMPTENLLCGMLNTRLGLQVLKRTEIDLKEPLSARNETEIKTLSHLLKYLPFTVHGVLGMEHAQVTAGGVLTSEFRADTLESRKVPGLFAAGEVLDIDGDCGGYNLQWAWSSGYVAGKLGKLEDGKC